MTPPGAEIQNDDCIAFSQSYCCEVHMCDAYKSKFELPVPNIYINLNDCYEYM